ncbi:serine hydrolase domain-containing protein [Jannaschia sp. 2305UL9-9]|uniref:serine hydrolase domain-containing protein n=1 Tax=Jannaschia sp. 2305UL9-9 TaxID=3121638 RepID=UPI0035274829
MRTWAKRLILGLLAITVICAAAALWKREEISRLLAVRSLFAPDRIVRNFSNMDAAFLHVPLTTEPGPPLPRAEPIDLPTGADQWIADRAITGLVVLRDGAMTHESYHLGTGAEDQRISWSVAKSFLSLLIGQLVADGTLELADPVVLHAPELLNSAYDGTSLLDVIQMESGVAFDENYFDKDSDINRMGRIIALGGALDDFTASFTLRDRDPGGAWKYVSIDTHVLGMVVRGATGRSIPDLMTERLLLPMGIGPASYLTDGVGTAFVLGGLTMRTVDYARMGLLVQQGGILSARQIVPDTWIEESTRASAHTAPGAVGYGYQWWIPADAAPGEVIARGVYGQYVYIDRASEVVIAINGADLQFNAPGVWDDMLGMFRRIAAKDT